MAFWDGISRVLSFPSSTSRFESFDAQAISGLNDPSASFYQSLVNALDGISSNGGLAGLAGLPSVNMENAGTNSAIYRAISLTCSVPASLPLQVFKDDAAGGQTKVTPPNMRHLWRHPNSEEGPQEFWETVKAHRKLAGDCFIYCDRNRLGEVVELHWIYPYRVQVGQDPETRRKVYTLDGNQDLPMVTAGLYEGEILHVRNLTWRRKGLRGMGIIDLAKLELQVDAAALQYGGRFFSQDSTPGGIITSDADIDDKVAAKLQARWEKSHKGLAGAHRIAVMGNGGKFQKTSTTPDEVQALPVRLAHIKAVARFFGTPTHLLMDSTGSTTWGGGLEEIGTGFVRFTLAPDNKPFEQALERIMPDTMTARRNFDALLRGTTLQRYQAYQIARLIGTKSPDDIRALENEPPIKDEDRWKYELPLNSNVSAAPAMDAAGNGDAADLQAQIDELTRKIAAMG